MKFYRLHVRTEGGASAGYEWYSSLSKAKKRRNEIVRDLRARMREPESREPYAPRLPCEADMPDEIEPVLVMPTKTSILGALRVYASHENNG